MSVIQTKFGTLEVKPTSATHIYIGSSDRDESMNLVIRGVPWRVGAHAHLYPDGKWRIGSPTAQEYQRRQELYMSRRDRYDSSGPTRAARDAALEEIEARINEWVAANPSEIDIAEDASRRNKIATIERKRQELLTEVRKLEAELRELGVDPS